MCTNQLSDENYFESQLRSITLENSGIARLTLYRPSEDKLHFENHRCSLPTPFMSLSLASLYIVLI